ncbi:MAG: hypothetical protein IJW68_02640 [Bacteroidaceae bacterium]|nr:hypothetical protein [Bacteroidaceae bacterium]MBQ8736139.1 hypothetical protein [Bacteroidaceae bacterium]
MSLHKEIKKKPSSLKEEVSPISDPMSRDHKRISRLSEGVQQFKEKQ